MISEKGNGAVSRESAPLQWGAKRARACLWPTAHCCPGTKYPGTKKAPLTRYNQGGREGEEKTAAAMRVGGELVPDRSQAEAEDRPQSQLVELVIL